jgi:hypothetical protein
MSRRGSVRTACGILVVAVALVSGGCNEPQNAVAARPSPSPSESALEESSIRINPPTAGMYDISPAAKRAAREVGFDLKESARKVHARVERFLPHTWPDIVIDARPGPRNLIAAGGHAEPGSGFVYVEIYPQFHGDFETQLPFDFRNALVHELNHSHRIWDGPGYGRTLLEAFISEGLAEAFTLQMYPKAELLSESALTPEEKRSIWPMARPLLHERDTSEGHDRWFFGKGDLPNATGYSLGLSIVQSYLQHHPREKASDLTLMPAKKIFRGSRYKP